MKKLDIKIGDKFNNFTLIDNKIFKMNNRYKVKVQCKCGSILFYEPYILKNKKYKGCNDCKNIFKENNPNWKGFQGVPGFKIADIKCQARNIDFKITAEDIWKQLEKQNHKCMYTDLPVSFDLKNVSIDRIDSNGIYEPSNIQIVHKHVNIMKNVFDEDYFLVLCSLISKNFQNKY
jgi:hypothetical protein